MIDNALFPAEGVDGTGNLRTICYKGERYKRGHVYLSTMFSSLRKADCVSEGSVLHVERYKVNLNILLSANLGLHLISNVESNPTTA